jgi:hypothetical protein
MSKKRRIFFTKETFDAIAELTPITSEENQKMLEELIINTPELWQMKAGIKKIAFLWGQQNRATKRRDNTVREKRMKRRRPLKCKKRTNAAFY